MIPEFASFDEFIDWTVDLFDTEYGTTSFFNNPYEAKEYVENHIIKPNPRLTDQEIGILLFWSEESLTAALAQTNYGPDAAVFYWTLMNEYINLYSYDARLQNVFDQASTAADDTLTATYDEDLPPSKLPWWLFLLPLLFFIPRRR